MAATTPETFITRWQDSGGHERGSGRLHNQHKDEKVRAEVESYHKHLELNPLITTRISPLVFRKLSQSH